MAKFWATPKFQKLQERWYQKLEKAGFEDIERHQKRLHTDTARFADAEAVKTYYQKAHEYSRQGEFHTGVERSAWEAHCAGLSLREIAKQEKKSKETIRRIIMKHVGLMKVMQYVD